MPEKIEDLTSPPVVGQTYNVPCVRTQLRRDGNMYSGVVADFPIIAPCHNDAIYNFGHTDHFHLDHRFFEDYVYDYWEEKASSIYQLKGNSLSLVLAKGATEGFGEIYRRDMSCEREAPTWPLQDCLFMLERLEPVFKDANIDCKTCPHRKTPLGSVKPVGGVIVCPAHGLSWDQATGRMIPRAQCEP